MIPNPILYGKIDAYINYIHDTRIIIWKSLTASVTYLPCSVLGAIGNGSLRHVSLLRTLLGPKMNEANLNSSSLQSVFYTSRIKENTEVT